jgi:signal transduction histidine kinase
MKKQNQKDLIFPFFTIGSLRLRIGWFINLRWFLIFILITINEISSINHYAIGINQLYILTAILVILNILFIFVDKYYPFHSFKQEIKFAEIQMILDILVVSFIIHYMGGIRNPFYFIYLIHIVISGVLFQNLMPYFNAFFAVMVLTIWTMLEYHQIVSIYPAHIKRLTLSEIAISLFAFYFLIFSITYILTDFISRFRKIKNMIDNKSELLKKTMEERDKIFRFTAHELKSPLTTLRSVLAVVQMLQDVPHEKERSRDLLARAVRRNDQVLEMVKDMIEITHFKQGKESKTKKKLNWGTWVDDKVRAIHEYAESKAIQLKYNDKTYDRDIMVPVDSMHKIVTNLINNAIRYTPNGGKVTVEAFVNAKKYGFIVKDTGIGMSKEDKEKIYDEFFRSAEARKMEKIGTGLGLSLVKEIVEKLGGEISVKSELGKGSEFRVVMRK